MDELRLILLEMLCVGDRIRVLNHSKPEILYPRITAIENTHIFFEDSIICPKEEIYVDHEVLETTIGRLQRKI
jgi:hypothetical protein